MIIIVYIALLLTACYVMLMLIYRAGWSGHLSFPYTGNTHRTSISVIIPARNEQQNIRQCLESVLAQDYPRALLEVIVVNDHSTDETENIVRSFEPQGVKCINLSDSIGEGAIVNSYKKQALTAGINASKGQLIVTTDADCTAGKNWLRCIAGIYEQKGSAMIIAPVSFTDNGSIVEVFQSLDFMSMQGITVATLHYKLGNMSNGANLAFARDKFDAVGGYKGIDHIASGDDYLLMNKMSKQFHDSIHYLKSEEAIVSTPPQPDWHSFLQQRIRWASKSGKYDDNKLTTILLFVYLFNVSFLVMVIMSMTVSGYWLYLLAMLGIKTAIELYYLYPVAVFYKKQKLLAIFSLLQPLHILYIITAGFLGFLGVYSWKGRKVK